MRLMACPTLPPVRPCNLGCSHRKSIGQQQPSRQQQLRQPCPVCLHSLLWQLSHLHCQRPGFHQHLPWRCETLHLPLYLLHVEHAQHPVATERPQLSAAISSMQQPTFAKLLSSLHMHFWWLCGSCRMTGCILYKQSMGNRASQLRLFLLGLAGAKLLLMA